MINLFKNEALCILCIQNFVSTYGSVDLEKVFLIPPLLFDKKVRNYFKRKDTKIISVQDTVTSKSEIFVGFNEKYRDLLITTTNAVLMGIEVGLFELDEGHLTCRDPVLDSASSINKTYSDIALASANAARFIEEPSATLYSLLRIKI
uniref:three component ABC system middle component n=1 Tax=Ningiella ruwaisensis TaxID=2364274 RepID=UPI00109FBE2A|nr:three component ABC system middle component [Ningiella ruwaisensis]